MRGNLSALLWRLAIFAVVGLLGMFTLITAFAQLRFGREQTYNAVFTTVSGLENGNFVRIAGVEVGKVTNIKIKGDSSALVAFGVDDSVVLTEGSKAVIKYDNLIGGRYLALEEGAGGTKKLHPGDTIQLDHTAPALDLDAVIGGFRPLLRALDPTQVNALTGQLIAAFQGEGAAVGSILSQIAALTSTLADRDQLIGQVIVNLNTVLGSLGDHNNQFGKAIDSLSELVHGLQARKQDISNGVAYANEAARSIADLLEQARPPLKKTVQETERTAATVLADRDYFDNLLNTLPDAYRVLLRQGLYGNYFTFYLCELVLKVNGKGGQPVYIRLANQATGRCAPK
ncbi:MCE family protein [Mycobacterium sp. 050128]|uniref:MCE family protein n=1 Tax=Mycobacterium TaxID=1763 RepID=UPI0004485EAF|nr:MCE family protein [Mycobacterium intracellulare]ARV80146.1 mammalian cell entry protein [Mycobacterium intracellulare subsp. chimaera]ASL18773.1 virulence factor Mce family protein [Mycobacterium intracellulare subsp. chimaera]ETZ36005.1 mce related family protein [Mycobacterium intracellulare MIN_052511_1280]KPN48882.1 mammalian cell entry protein [Mycobacterium intracellulare subsp. chimaera]KPN48984.1 mammalian cell entry protein [Mycobacterium intracellulare subsp. chimaera]